MWSRWLVTVRIEMYSRPAISRFVSPSVEQTGDLQFTCGERSVRQASRSRRCLRRQEGDDRGRRATPLRTRRAVSSAIVKRSRPHRSRSISAASITRSAASRRRPRPSRISAARDELVHLVGRGRCHVAAAPGTPMPTAAIGRHPRRRVRRSPPSARPRRRRGRARAPRHRRTRSPPPVPAPGRRRPRRSPPPPPRSRRAVPIASRRPPVHAVETGGAVGRDVGRLFGARRAAPAPRSGPST